MFNSLFKFFWDLLASLNHHVKSHHVSELSHRRQLRFVEILGELFFELLFRLLLAFLRFLIKFHVAINFFNFRYNENLTSDLFLLLSIGDDLLLLDLLFKLFDFLDLLLLVSDFLEKILFELAHKIRVNGLGSFVALRFFVLLGSAITHLSIFVFI